MFTDLTTGLKEYGYSRITCSLSPSAPKSVPVNNPTQPSWKWNISQVSLRTSKAESCETKFEKLRKTGHQLLRVISLGTTLCSKVKTKVLSKADCPLPLRMLSFFSRAGTSREKKTRLSAAKALLASVFFKNCHFSVTNLKWQLLKKTVNNHLFCNEYYKSKCYGT